MQLKRNATSFKCHGRFVDYVLSVINGAPSLRGTQVLKGTLPLVLMVVREQALTAHTMREVVLKTLIY